MNNVSKMTEIHNKMRDELNACARACGVHPGIGEPRAVQGSSEGFRGGADGKITGVSKQASNQSTTLLYDITCPAARAPSTVAKRPKHAGNKPGFVARDHEFKKKRDHEYAATAERNGWDFFGAVIIKDSCFLGQGTKDLLNRITAHRRGEEFESEGYNSELFKAGVFSPAKAKAYWTRALLVAMINRREQAISEGKAKAEASGN